MTIADAASLLETLRNLPHETEWVEFKRNRFVPDEVGKQISALANAAMLANERHAYLIYGVDDQTHDVVGTNVRLKAEKKGAELFEAWVARLLNPRIVIEFDSVETDKGHVEILRIDPGYIQPVRFQSEAYVRVNSVRQLLGQHPNRERALWAITSRFSFEKGIALSHVSEKDIFEKFSPAKLFAQLGTERLSEEAIVQRLVQEGLIVDDHQRGFDISNLMALLAAKDLSTVPLLSQKAPRVITYKGESKLTGEDDVTGKRGYCLSFQSMLEYIMARIPHREVMSHGVRKTHYDIPMVAVREFVANALIHQDLTESGSGPRVEIFKGKIKITNPGEPLVPTDRFIDAPPKSRNEGLAGFMRRAGLCEERGSGIDRALDAIEREMLPPPDFQVVAGSTVVTVFGPRRFAKMSREDRLRAVYQHASLRWEAGDRMSNQSLRKRLGMSDSQIAQVSRLISEAIEAGLIRPVDSDQAKRTARYVPVWA